MSPLTHEAEILQQIGACFTVPVLRVNEPQRLFTLADQWVNQGVSVLEVPWTVPDAPQMVRALSVRYQGGVLLGAGSVLTPAHLEQAARAGCRFAATPANWPGWIATCRQLEMLPIPGALTPTEIALAVEQGADLIKVFPISSVGGAAYVAALRGPWPEIQLMPCGGIRPDEVETYRQAGAFAIGIGRALLHPSPQLAVHTPC